MKIQEKDISLVMAFIENDCKSFTSVDVAKKSKAIFDKISKMLGKLKNGANFVIFEQLTNLGQIDASLSVTPIPWDWRGGNINISLYPGENGEPSLHRNGEHKK